jgi:Protein of unknown function (DUF1573)
MKKNLFNFLLLTLFGCNQIQSNNDKYKISKDTINFGQLESTDTLLYTLQIKNISDSIIKITNIESACGCTSVLLKDSTLKVSDSIPIQITYIPSLNKDSGRIIKFITFRTNSYPVFKNLIITGNILKNEK